MLLDINDRTNSPAITQITKSRDGALIVYFSCGYSGNAIDFAKSIFPNGCDSISEQKAMWTAGGSAYAGGSVGTAVKFMFANSNSRKLVVREMERISSEQWLKRNKS